MAMSQRGETMNYLVRFAFAALTIALAAGADTAPKRSADPNTTITPSLRSTLGFSPWRALYLQRNGVLNTQKRKDFNDTRFEYRWKSEWVVIREVCTVEIRPSEDVDVSDTIPTISIAYVDPHSHGHVHPFIVKNVAVSNVAHASLKPTDCERIDLVYWSK
jgi:hypothetical protein